MRWSLRVLTAAGLGIALVAGPAAAVPRGPIIGTDGPDTLTGTPRSDLIRGLGGADTISGRGRADTAYGGAGNDNIAGGPGADRLFAGTGENRISGGPGIDMVQLERGGGVDRVNCGASFDEVFGAGPRDRLTGCERVSLRVR